MRIGIDFDNTIISYDAVFLAAARARGLIDGGFTGTTKQAIRDRIRELPDGEAAWQGLQGFVYGAGIDGAVMFEGVDAFLRRCRIEGHTVFIVSHKTEYGHFDPEHVNLREAALGWMDRHGFFRPDGYGLAREQVFFESTREEKLRRIAALACTAFVDDLAEVFADPAFPDAMRRILFTHGGPRATLRVFAPPTSPSVAAPCSVCSNWTEIEACVLNGRR